MKKEGQMELDFGEILHRHSSQLISLFHSLESAIDFLEIKEAKKFRDNEEFYDILHKQVLEICSLISGKVLKHARMSPDSGTMSELREELIDIERLFNKYLNSSQDKKQRPPYLRAEINRLIRSIKSVQVPEDLNLVLNELVVSAKKTLGTICYHDLKTVQTSVSDMNQQTSALREYYWNQMRPPESPRIMKAHDVISSAIRDQDEYAKTRNIHLKHIDRSNAASVRVDRMRVSRGMSNLLNNAIKYNYQLHGEEKAWVKIVCESDREKVYFTIENWGVPITREELESGKIYRLAGRGKYSRRFEISGNGVGLTDARQIFEACGGSVTIDSRPTRNITDDHDLSKTPFITTVKATLPKADILSEKERQELKSNSNEKLEFFSRHHSEGDTIKGRIFETDRRTCSILFEENGQQFICEMSFLDLSHLEDVYMLRNHYYTEDLNFYIKRIYFPKGKIYVSLKATLQDNLDEIEFGNELQAKILTPVRRGLYWVLIEDYYEGLLETESKHEIGQLVKVTLLNRSRQLFAISK